MSLFTASQECLMTKPIERCTVVSIGITIFCIITIFPWSCLRSVVMCLVFDTYFFSQPPQCILWKRLSLGFLFHLMEIKSCIHWKPIMLVETSIDNSSLIIQSMLKKTYGNLYHSEVLSWIMIAYLQFWRLISLNLLLRR
jgi:hypothetical protein